MLPSLRPGSAIGSLPASAQTTAAYAQSIEAARQHLLNKANALAGSAGNSDVPLSADAGTGQNTSASAQSVAPPTVIDNSSQAGEPSGSGDLYVVDYYRRGDGPDGGEMYGMYSTKAQADKAVADVKKWAATIKDPDWQITKVEEQKLESAPDTATSTKAGAVSGKRGVEGFSYDEKGVVSLTPGRGAGPVTSSQAQRLVPGQTKASERVDKVEMTLAGLDGMATAWERALKQSLQNLPAAQLAMQRSIARQVVDGTLTQGKALAEFRQVNRFIQRRAGILEHKLQLTEGVGGLLKTADVANAVRIAVQNAPPGQGVAEGARAASSKITGMLVSDLVEGALTEVAVGAGLTVGITSLPAAVAMGAVLGVAAVVGSYAEDAMNYALPRLKHQVRGTPLPDTQQ